ncbi:hypothetical protein [Cupriavidus sp. CuC1]|uniref:hypothetical protein n=1 Tax=Cupriavidus sp. CuC1 TaxID=3373131 RepID=UPI0037D65EDF
MPDLAKLCLLEVAETHVLIEQWLSSADCPDAVLETLLQRFGPGFSMISPTGARMEQGGFPALFARLRGARPGLQIKIDELTLVQVDARSATVSYRETQAWNTGTSERLATALFVARDDARVTWRHLHETWA